MEILNTILSELKTAIESNEALIYDGVVSGSDVDYLRAKNNGLHEAIYIVEKCIREGV